MMSPKVAKVSPNSVQLWSGDQKPPPLMSALIIPIPGCLRPPEKPLYVENDLLPEVTVQPKFENVNGPPGLEMALASVPAWNLKKVSTPPKEVPPIMSISPAAALF